MKTISPKAIQLVEADIANVRAIAPAVLDRNIVVTLEPQYQAGQRKAIRQNKPDVYALYSDAVRHLNRLLTPNYPW